MKVDKIPDTLEFNEDVFIRPLGFAWEQFSKIVNKQGNYGGFIVYVSEEIAKKLQE